jgi:hypothetical protein
MINDILTQNLILKFDNNLVDQQSSKMCLITFSKQLMNIRCHNSLTLHSMQLAAILNDINDDFQVYI